MVTMKRKYKRSLSPAFEEDGGYDLLVNVVQEIQALLNIKSNVSILLKEKHSLFSSVVGNAFDNTATGCISCHVYVHRHSTLSGTILVLAHELFHAWQIDTNQPKVPDWEEEAELFSMRYLEGWLQSNGCDCPVSTAKLIREFVH